MGTGSESHCAHRRNHRLSIAMLTLSTVCIAISAMPARASAADLPTSTVQHDFNFAASQLAATVGDIPVTSYPALTNASGAWSTTGSTAWTSGFFPGLLWEMYDRTGDPAWRTRAQSWQAGVAPQQFDNSTHDIGFQIMSSFGNGYRLVGDDAYRQVILTAANTLATRYNATVGAIRSWDAINDTTQFRVIIDNMMNLELLFWAAAHGGSQTLHDIAVSHALRTMQDFIRPDGSTWQLVNYDQKTGAVLSKSTVQGYSNDSTWARGQAWAVYGFTMSYRYTGDTRFLDAARATADYFIGHLPADDVPYWDFSLPSTAGQPRDSSAAAIAASGLLELSQLDTDATRQQTYFGAARDILASLSSSAYLAEGTSNHAVLLHGTQNKPAGSYDTGLIYGDYYFLEALKRFNAITSPAPDPPTNVAATPGNGSASVSWTAPADNGSPITSYTVTASPGGASGTSPGGTTSANVAGLTNGVAYTFTVTATSALGTSSPSFPSNSVTPTAGVSSLWPSGSPAVAAASDANPVELGVKFTSDVNGYVTGVRFYKGSTNTGTHIGNLWSSAGSLLASATFTNETASGWQTVTFASPVPVTANTTYIASYHTNVGHYAYTVNAFTNPFNAPPLHALANSTSGGNGVYLYSPTSVFPTNNNGKATNYWVDITFTTTSGKASQTITFAALPNLTLAQSPTTVNATASSGLPVTFSTTTPAVCTSGGNNGATITLIATGTCTVQADQAGNTIYNPAPPIQQRFTVSASAQTYSMWPSGSPAVAAASDANPVELGVKFTSDVNGYVTGVRFYKGSTNTGTHIGNLWSSAGSLLASATFTNETASGWQTVTFASPVPVTANTTYIASYHTNVGHYAYTVNAFTNPFNAPPLHALANSTSGGNGVYLYSPTSVFPTNNNGKATNYWVDITFTTTP